MRSILIRRILINLKLSALEVYEVVTFLAR